MPRMGQSIRAGFLLFLFALSLPVQTLNQENPAVPPTNLCSSTAREALFDFMGPVAGSKPVWLLDASAGQGFEPDSPINLYWVVARTHRGDLVVTGRRLDGPGIAKFHHRVGSPIRKKLIIPKAHKPAMFPGKASEEVLRAYAFHGSYGYFPSPGCWELVARFGSTQTKIVVNLQPSKMH